jgi:uncharacterized membrane protein
MERFFMIVLRVIVLMTVLLAFMGVLDCVTTVAGIHFFGAFEQNPLMASLIQTNLSVFVATKLAAIVFVCFSIFQADRLIGSIKDKTSRAFKYSNRLLKVTLFGLLGFAVFTVANNSVVIFSLFLT